MKYKNYINKICSAVIMAAVVCSGGALLLGKAAKNNLTTGNTEDVNVSDSKILYASNSYFNVTIPKRITLDGNTKQANYSVKVSGDIASNQAVVVLAEDDVSDIDDINFYMKDMNTVEQKKADVLADVAHAKTDWNFEDAKNSVVSNDNSVSAPDLTAGSWQGSFNFKIMLALNIGTSTRELCGDDFMIYGGTKDTDYSYDETSNVLTIKTSERLTIQNINASAGGNFQNLNITGSNANITLYGDWIIPSNAKVTISNGTKVTMASGSRLILMEGIGYDLKPDLTSSQLAYVNMRLEQDPNFYSSSYMQEKTTELTADAGDQAITADGQGTGITLEGNAKIIINNKACLMLSNCAYLYIKDMDGRVEANRNEGILGRDGKIYAYSIDSLEGVWLRGTISGKYFGQGGSPFPEP